MSLSPHHLPAAIVLAAALGLAGCTSAATPAMDDKPATSTPSDMAEHEDMDAEAMAPGAYLTLTEYQERMADRAGTAVVYFFHADWCPSCRATDTSLTQDGVPDGLTVVKVDYDTETDLKQQYGITQQHTFAQVGTDGEELAKWSGSTTGDEIKAETVHP